MKLEVSRNMMKQVGGTVGNLLASIRLKEDKKPGLEIKIPQTSQFAIKAVDWN